MSNLGGYQTLTTFAKKVGGPGKLVLLIAGGGAIVGGIAVKSGEFAIKKARDAFAKYREKKHNNSHESEQIIYTIKQNGESNEGVVFNVGDKVKVLEADGDAVLIELIGNNNNPYFVSMNLLEQISDYHEIGGI